MTITVKHTKVSTIPDGDDSSLIRPSDWNADHQLVGLGTMAEQNANNVSITGGSISGATVSGYIPTADEGVANGVATLDGSGKVPIAQIPDAVIGALNYQGTWNASTNTPTLTSSVGTKGYYYVVSVAGTTNLNGVTDWQIGDWAVYNGTAWQKVDNTDGVTSVNGYTGAVVLTQPDIAGTANAPTNTNITSMTGITGGISSPDFIQLDTAAAASIALAKLRWNVDTATAAFGIIDGTTEVNIGEQMYAYVTNAESTTITAGQAVYLYAATGNRASVKLANNTGDATSAKTLGLVTQDIAAGATGFVTTQGVLAKLDTSAFTEGATLYLGATAGSLTATKPKAPNHLVYIGVVEKANAGNGQIYVRPQNGYELDEIHDVQINSPANGQTILYDASTSLWKNANLTAGTAISVTNGAASVTIANTGVTSAVAGTGISVSGATGAVTVTNTAPDQTVAIASGTGISVTGTYPNFTVTNTSPSSGGTVTSITAGTGLSGGTITTSGTIALDNTTVAAGSYTNSSITVDAQGRLTSASSGTAPVTNVGVVGPLATTGGTTPTLSMPAASASQSGYLTSTDWSTFNSKGSGTVTSVTGTAPIVSSGGNTPAISIPAATSSVNGYLTSTDWTTFNSKLTNPMSAVGDTIYGGTSGAATRLAGNTTTAKQFLSQTGTGSASQAPAWSALPTVLPVLNRAGSSVSVSVGNGVLPVLNRSGSTINVAVQ